LVLAAVWAGRALLEVPTDFVDVFDFFKAGWAAGPVQIAQEAMKIVVTMAARKSGLRRQGLQDKVPEDGAGG
jgi:hypothetical protein